MRFCFFFFNDTATTEIYTLSLHDALPIFKQLEEAIPALMDSAQIPNLAVAFIDQGKLLWSKSFGVLSKQRSEEHTSELQSRQYLVCRLLLEKKKIPHSYISPLYRLLLLIL